MNNVEICIAAFVILLILIIVIVILRNRPFKYRKRNHGQSTTLTIVANKRLHKVNVQAKFGKEEINFERKRIRKGQAIEFTYPISDKPTKITVEVKPGKPRVFEV